GGLANFVAIIANGGVMPASRRALEIAGHAHVHGFANSTAVAHPKLLFLGDVFAIPPSVPLHNVFSIGDVLIVVGIFLALHRQCESYLAYVFARAADRMRGHPLGRPAGGYEAQPARRAAGPVMSWRAGAVAGALVAAAALLHAA